MSALIIILAIVAFLAILGYIAVRCRRAKEKKLAPVQAIFSKIRTITPDKNPTEEGWSAGLYTRSYYLQSPGKDPRLKVHYSRYLQTYPGWKKDMTGEILRILDNGKEVFNAQITERWTTGLILRTDVDGDWKDELYSME